MQYNKGNVERFLALSYLYFRLTDKTSGTIDNDELSEFIESINECSPPQMSPEQYIA